MSGVLEQSGWQDTVRDEEYQVVQVDSVNSVAEVLTIWIGASDARPPFFLTVADVDWSALLKNFTDHVTTTGEGDAMLAHKMLVSKLRELMAVDTEDQQVPQAVA